MEPWYVQTQCYHLGPDRFKVRAQQQIRLSYKQILDELVLLWLRFGVQLVSHLQRNSQHELLMFCL